MPEPNNSLNELQLKQLTLPQNKLLVHKTGLIDPTQIKFDRSNPNSMSEEKFESLKKVITKYGFGDTVRLTMTEPA